MEYEQAKVTLDRFKSRLDRLRLYAPFDGIIETVTVDVGQSVGEEDPVLRVVNTDSLRMDVAANTDETLRLGLKPGDAAWVLIDVPGEHRVYVGEITEVSPVAYYATRQRRVRVEMPNPDGWPAGLPAWVRFTEPTGEWAEKTVTLAEPAAGPVSMLEGTADGDGHR
jgi:membrane fusion protein (multidrug efflux system)